jgi:hypothetical protein
MYKYGYQEIAEHNYKVTVVCFPVGGKTKKVIDARQPGNTKAPEILQTTPVRLIKRQYRRGENKWNVVQLIEL